jgi:hypothetical protein
MRALNFLFIRICLCFYRESTDKVILSFADDCQPGLGPYFATTSSSNSNSNPAERHSIKFPAFVSVDQAAEIINLIVEKKIIRTGHSQLSESRHVRASPPLLHPRFFSSMLPRQ